MDILNRDGAIILRLDERKYRGAQPLFRGQGFEQEWCACGRKAGLVTPYDKTSRRM
jgi:hypothetical protein